QPEVKPRLPLASILKTDYYQDEDDAAQVDAFDAEMRQYYRERTGGNKDTTWSEQLKPLFTTKVRPHMRQFLQDRGFEMK
ncbi:MAG: oxygen-insensitive NADPH nitroreductase, partial [Marinobacter sp.]|nr:oxygen-insensitive NADPH nitroreductase [Marinobacter sp.]